MAKTANKTQATAASVDDFLDAVADPQRRADGKTLRAMMERLSGEPATMWGPSIVGFGRYHYKYESGREDDWARIGYAPRAKELVLYLLGGFSRQQELLDRLGKYRTSVSCLYIKRLSDVDMAVLEELTAESLAYMDAKYPRS